MSHGRCASARPAQPGERDTSPRAGERLRITVSGRPVAELTPLARKPDRMTAAEFWRALARAQADAQLAGDLRSALPDSTDDVELR